MRIIQGDTLSQVMYNGFRDVSQHGEIQPTRNGSAKALYDVTFELQNPRARHLNLTGRKSNIFQLIAETFWVMAGHDLVDPYLSFFLPRAKNYSDDGYRWHGAYGPRLYDFCQLETAVHQFKSDGKQTRRSFAMIADPTRDNAFAIQKAYGEGHVAKDIPCNREIHFYVENNKFSAKTIQRSGDMLFGTGSINPFEFSFLQELMYNEVKKIHPEVELGPYRWHVTNAHVYSEFYPQVDEVLDTRQRAVAYDRSRPLVTTSVSTWKIMFSIFVEKLTEHIQTPTPNAGALMEAHQKKHDEMIDALVYLGLPLVDNILVDYILLSLFYITAKKAKDAGLEVSFNLVYDLDPELRDAVLASPFRKFSVNGQ